MGSQVFVVAAEGVMVSFVSRDEKAVPGLMFPGGQDQHEPSVEITALTTEHRLLDIRRLL